MMLESSRDGVQILRALALAIRSEQDFNLMPREHSVVGAIKREGAGPSDALDIKQRGGYPNIPESGYADLGLRQALNAIAHADPSSSDYHVGPGDQRHDLLLFGNDRGRHWLAVLSLPRFIAAVRALPDMLVEHPDDNR